MYRFIPNNGSYSIQDGKGRFLKAVDGDPVWCKRLASAAKFDSISVMEIIDWLTQIQP